MTNVIHSAPILYCVLVTELRIDSCTFSGNGNVMHLVDILNITVQNTVIADNNGANVDLGRIALSESAHF